MTLNTEQKYILPAIAAAAHLTIQVRDSLITAVEKAGREPVTIADFGSQAIICRAIQEHFPDDAIVAEESAADFLGKLSAGAQALVTGLVSDQVHQPVDENMICGWLDYGKDKTAARTWVIDPIDGTKGFIAGRHYTIAVGFLMDGVPSFGALGCPAYTPETGYIFYTEDSNVYRVPLHEEQQPAPIAASTQADAASSRGVESFESGHTDHSTLDRIRVELGTTPELVVRMDGQDKYAAVACGDAEYYLRLSPDADRKERIWDHAAGVALVQAAGGIVTDLDGKPLDFSQGKTLASNRGIIACNQTLQEQLLQAVQQAQA